MAIWTTPVIDRVIEDVSNLKSTIGRIELAGWDTNTDQNISDKWYWKYGDGTIYDLSASGDILQTSSGQFLVVHSEAETIKGAWNYFDANRVIANSIFLRDLMNSLGYPVTFSDQTLLDEYSFPYQSSVNGLYKINIQKLLDAFYPFDHPTFSYSNTAPIYTNANGMELCLKLLYDYLANMQLEFQNCGTYYSGEDIIM